MCEPTAMFAATAAASFGSAFMGAQADGANYNKKMKALAQEADAIKNSTIFKYHLAQMQQSQIQDRAAVEVGDRRHKLFEAKGTASAAAASAGVEGNSVAALLQGFDVATGSDISNIFANRDAEVAQSRMEMKGFQMDADARLTGLRNQAPEDPSTHILGRFFNAALQTGTAYANYSTPYQKPDGSMGRRLGGYGI